MYIIPCMMDKHRLGNVHKDLMKSMLPDTNTEMSMVRCKCLMFVPIKSLTKHQNGGKCKDNIDKIKKANDIAF